MTGCKIIRAAKRRDGKYRYWCLEHKANATAKYGVQMKQCEAAKDPSIQEDDILRLDINDFKGSIALWGAVPAVYDTTGMKVDRGIHVHARERLSAEKVIDRTYRKLVLDTGTETIEIFEQDAIYYMTAVVFGHQLKEVLCSHCDYSHLDKDVLAVKPHKKHLCAGCGRDFFDSERHIGNPIMGVKEKLNDHKVQRQTKNANRDLDIKQSDFAGGISIWGANQALLWLSEVKEEDGIHVHAYNDQGNRLVDDTYSSVTIDGKKLNVDQVKMFMAQMAIPHIKDSVYSLNCPACSKPHFDTGKYAYTLHKIHQCEYCEHKFSSPYKKKKTISNPVLAVLEKLEDATNLNRSVPYIDLRREG